MVRVAMRAISIGIIFLLSTGCSPRVPGEQERLKAEFEKMYPSTPEEIAAREKCSGGSIRGGSAFSRQLRRDINSIRRDLCFREMKRENELKRQAFKQQLENLRRENVATEKAR